MATTDDPFKLIFVGQDIAIHNDSETNYPLWFMITLFASFVFCAIAILAWLLFSICTLNREKPCHHPIYEAHYGRNTDKTEVKGTMKSTEKKKLESLNDTDLTKSMKSRKSSKDPSKKSTTEASRKSSKRSSKRSSRKKDETLRDDEEKKSSVSGSKESADPRNDGGMDSVALDIDDGHAHSKSRYFKSLANSIFFWKL